MSAQRPHDHAVRRGEDIHIEVDVHLRGREDHHVQLVGHISLGLGVGVHLRIHLDVPGVVPDRGHGVRVEGLYIQKGLKVALLQHLRHGGGDAAGGEGALDVVFLHILLQIPGHRQGDSTAARLVGEAVFHQAGGDDHLAGVVGDGQLYRFFGLSGGPLTDELGIADPLHLYHAVHRSLGNADGVGRIGHQMVGNGHHLFGEPGVHFRVAHGAKGRWA